MVEDRFSDSEPHSSPILLSDHCEASVKENEAYLTLTLMNDELSERTSETLAYVWRVSNLVPSSMSVERCERTNSHRIT